MRELTLFPSDYNWIKPEARKRSPSWVIRKLWRLEQRRAKLAQRVHVEQRPKRLEKLEAQLLMCEARLNFYFLVRLEQRHYLPEVDSPVFILPPSSS